MLELARTLTCIQVCASGLTPHGKSLGAGEALTGMSKCNNCIDRTETPDRTLYRYLGLGLQAWGAKRAQSYNGKQIVACGQGRLGWADLQVLKRTGTVEV